MYTIEYSPFQHNSLQCTDKRSTTSYKKYPANKYDDPSDLKHQLFQGIYNLNAQQSKDSETFFFKNPKINKSLNGNQLDAVIKISRHLTNQTYGRPNNRSYSINHYTKHYKPPKHKNKKSNSIKHKVRSNSCQLSVKDTKRTVPLKQQNQQLEMYKKLCVTLRKRNQDLQLKIAKQSKHQSLFSSEVQKLKDKIRKMYNHCIEKNKFGENVDLDLKNLIRKHTRKQNNIMRTNQGKQNSYIECKKVLKKIQFQKERQGHGIKRMNINNNKQTIDTTGMSKRDIKNESFRDDTSFKKNTTKSIKFVNCQLKQPLMSQKNTQNETFKQATNFPQYDQSLSETQNVQTIINTEENNKYKEFFSTFTKSIQIFQGSQSAQHKVKARHLKQAGYEVQWAKQEWLQIVEYLIQKGYRSSNSLKKTKRAQTTLKSIR